MHKFYCLIIMYDFNNYICRITLITKTNRHYKTPFMKRITFVPNLLAIVLFSGIGMVSCQKSFDVKDPQASRAVSIDDAASFSAKQNIINITDMEQTVLALHPELSSEVVLGGSCPPVKTYDPAPDVYPHTLTIDWGTGCTNPDGITRSGKIINYYSGDMADTGSFVLTTYDNYFINGVKIEGQSKLSHNIRKGNIDLQNKYMIRDFDRKVTQPNGDYTIYGGTRSIQKLDTDPEFPGFPDGWFRVKGFITGTEMKGGETYNWTATIEEPLVYQYCDYIVFGTMNVNFSNKDKWFVSYGERRECDDQAFITINGVTTPVTLPLDF